MGAAVPQAAKERILSANLQGLIDADSQGEGVRL